MCTLLNIGWINNKVLLHSTGNYIQYPVINHNGKDYKKECYLSLDDKIKGLKDSVYQVLFQGLYTQ